jgi:type II secretory pathway pseudopilin PulG
MEIGMNLQQHAAIRQRRRSARADAGDTLVEVVLTVVIIGLTVTALLSALATSGNAGNVQRSSVQMDETMRNYAEATKSAVQQCTVGGTFAVVFAPPSGYAVSTTPSGTSCPPVTTPTLLTLAVQGPFGVHESMQIVVRTP